VAKRQRERAGELNKMTTRGFCDHGDYFMTVICRTVVPPIDIFENNNNIKRKITKVNGGMYFSYTFVSAAV
jgi:hypothetical protein